LTVAGAVDVQDQAGTHGRGRPAQGRLVAADGGVVAGPNLYARRGVAGVAELGVDGAVGVKPTTRVPTELQHIAEVAKELLVGAVKLEIVAVGCVPDHRDPVGSHVPEIPVTVGVAQLDALAGARHARESHAQAAGDVGAARGDGADHGAADPAVQNVVRPVIGEGVARVEL